MSLGRLLGGLSLLLLVFADATWSASREECRAICGAALSACPSNQSPSDHLGAD